MNALAECFGTTHEVCMGGHPGKLYLPLLEAAGPGSFSFPKIFVLGESRFGFDGQSERRDWGESNSHGPDGQPVAAHILQVHVQLTGFPEGQITYLGSIGGRGPATGDVIQTFFETIDSWLSLFRDWVGTLSNQYTGSMSPFNGNGTNTSVSASGSGAVMWVRDGDGRSSPSGNNHITLNLSSPQALTPEGLKVALDRTSNGIPAPPARVFLTQARNRLWEGDYRAAVIDAGTAAELALWRLLEREAANVPPFLLDKLTQNLTLGRLREVLSHTGLPANLTPDLIKVRNQVAHKGSVPTAAEARTALDVSAAVAEMVHPSPPGLSVDP